MNILVIGNGFDIAHDLPTKYNQFLEFINKKDEMVNLLINNGLDENNAILIKKDIEQLCTGNFWIEHFINISNAKENWIDFEKEISSVIQALDDIHKKVNSSTLDVIGGIDGNLYVGILKKHMNLCNEIEWEKNCEDPLFIEKLKDKLIEDLDRLIRCLEIYLCQYVNRINIDGKEIAFLKNIKMDYVISFNYTDTYERLYIDSNPECFYIHGKAKCDSTINTCNIVLGIDEYLDENEKDSNNVFIEFKKFFQRIYKGTGAEYKKWIHNAEEVIKRNADAKNINDNIYIVGHSLDITDKDILEEILLLKHANIYILYHDKKALIEKISNVNKLIGQRELIDRTYACAPKIFFVEQWKNHI